ncbi:hypothetical protein AYI70_g10904, partial [Smittium culicis]
MRSFFSIATTVAFIAMCSVTADNLRSTNSQVGSSSNNMICITTDSYTKIDRSEVNNFDVIKNLSPLQHPIKNKCAPGYNFVDINVAISKFDKTAKNVIGNFNKNA